MASHANFLSYENHFLVFIVLSCRIEKQGLIEPCSTSSGKGKRRGMTAAIQSTDLLINNERKAVSFVGPIANSRHRQHQTSLFGIPLSNFTCVFRSGRNRYLHPTSANNLYHQHRSTYSEHLLLHLLHERHSAFMHDFLLDTIKCFHRLLELEYKHGQQ